MLLFEKKKKEKKRHFKELKKRLEVDNIDDQSKHLHNGEYF